MKEIENETNPVGVGVPAQTWRTLRKEVMQIQKELLTQIATYLQVNVYELFTLAFDYYKSELPDVTPKVDYEQFISSNGSTIPKYVSDFCELIVEAM